MTTEARPEIPPLERLGRAAAFRSVIEAIRSNDEKAVIRSLLSSANLREDQRLLMDSLLEMEDVARPDELGCPDASPVEDDGELAGLREGNDALAAALGACPLCWGGKEDCPVCVGDGCPGFAVPDRDLFRELVIPAVQRMRSHGTSPARPRSAPVR